MKIDDALRKCAEVILRKALKYTPVDTKALYNSGHVEGEGKGFGARYRVVFGGPDAPYAIYVHERLDQHHEPPTCAKFLERGARETQGTCSSILKRTLVSGTALTEYASDAPGESARVVVGGNAGKDLTR